MTIQITSNEDTEESDVEIEDEEAPLDGTTASETNKLPIVVILVIAAVLAIGGVFGVRAIKK